MFLGTARLGERGYTGLRLPVYGKVGNGLNWPVAGSGSEMIFGGKRLRRGLLCAL
jgi:hypothetical protein